MTELMVVLEAIVGKIDLLAEGQVSLRQELKGDIADLRTELKSDIAILDLKISAVDKKVNTLDKKLSTLDEKVDSYYVELKSDITQMNTDMGDSFAVVMEYIMSMRQEIADIRAEIELLKKNQTEPARVAKLESRVDRAESILLQMQKVHT